MTQVVSAQTAPRRHRRFRRAPLIVFSGIDGAGKSTQVELLFRELEERGRHPQKIWARGGYTSGMGLVKKILRRSTGNRLVPPSGQSAARSNAFAKPRTRRWWLRFAILDLMRLYGLWARWQLFWGRPVICDRYLEDTLLDFQMHFPQENVKSWIWWRLVTKVSPQPNVRLLMLVPLEESQARSLQKNEPFPDPPEQLARRLEAYNKWQSTGDWHVLDGRRPVGQLASEIWQLVAACDA